MINESESPKSSFRHNLHPASDQKTFLAKVGSHSLLIKKMLKKVKNPKSFGHKTFISSKCKQSI